MSIQDKINEIKLSLEHAILTGGIQGKESLIRSKKLINILHEAIKQELIDKGLNQNNLYPPLNNTTPELKIAGFLKQKDQDICIVPSNVKRMPRKINWGPLKAENQIDALGQDYAEKTLVINVRSQLSSLAKNTDTLFERTFAEALNLHAIYNKMVLGEVYLIPVYEYDDNAMKYNQIRFKNNRTNLEKYISFFSALSGRTNINTDHYMYERCALIIADFSQTPCRIYNSTSELINDNLIKSNFDIELSNISFNNFVNDLLAAYSKRFDLSNILNFDSASN